MASRIRGFLGLGSISLLGACSITVQTGPAAPAGYVAPPAPGVPVVVAPTPVYYPAPRPARTPGSPVVVVPAPAAHQPATPPLRSAERPPIVRPPAAGGVVNVPPVAPTPGAPTPASTVPASPPVAATPPAGTGPIAPGATMAPPPRKPGNPRSEKKPESGPSVK